MNAVLDDLHDKTEDGKREVGKFLDDVEELIARVTHVSDADVRRVRGKVEQSLRDVRDGIANKTRGARQQAGEIATSADKFAHSQPWAVVGAVAVIGLALGAALTRR